MYGTRLGTGVHVATGLPFPTTLGGTTVTVNEKPIGLYAVSENQVNAVLPDDIGGLVTMTVRTGEGSHSINILIENAVPSVFTLSQTGSAQGFAGLDQVNIVVPAGVRTGTSVPLLIKSGKRVSNTTTLAIR